MCYQSIPCTICYHRVEFVVSCILVTTHLTYQLTTVIHIKSLLFCVNCMILCNFSLSLCHVLFIVVLFFDVRLSHHIKFT